MPPIAGVLCGVMVAAAPLSAQEPPGPATAPAAAVTAQIFDEFPAPQAPETAEQIEAARALLARTRHLLAPLVPPTQPAEGEAPPWLEQLNALTGLLARYQERLDRLVQIEAALARLQSPEHAQQLQQQVLEFEEKTRALRRRLRWLGATPVVPEEVQALADEYAERNAEFDAKDKELTGLAERESRVQARLQELAKALPALREALAGARRPAEEALAAATTDAQRVEAVLGWLTAWWSLSDALLERRVLEREQVLVPLQRSALQRYRDALHAYVLALGDFRLRAEQQLTQSEGQYIAARLEEARTDLERSYWQARRVVHEYLQRFQEFEPPLRERFRESELQTIRRTVERQRLVWQHFLDTLDRKPTAAIVEAFHDITGEIARLRQVLADLRAREDRTFGELLAVMDLEEQAKARIAAAEQALIAQVRLITDADERSAAEKLLADFQAGRKPQLLSRIASVRSTIEEELLPRLREAIALLTARPEPGQPGHIEWLERVRDRLAWARRLRPDPGPVWQRWQALPRQVAALWEGRAALAEQARTTLRTGLEQASNAGFVRWLGAGACLLLSIIAGLEGRRRLRRWARRREERLRETLEASGQTTVLLRDRVPLAAAYFLARIARPVFPLVGLGLAAQFIPLRGAPRAALLAVVTLVAGFLVLHHLIGVAFQATKPRFRVFRCSNVVAAYYRRWLRGLLVVLAVLVPLPLLAQAAGQEPLAATLWQHVRLVGWVWLVLFLLRRDRVLRLFGRPGAGRPPRAVALLRLVYPLLWLGAVALLVAEVLGYGALTVYVLRSTALSAVLVIVLLSVTRVLSEAAEYYDALEREQEAALAARRAAPQQEDVPAAPPPRSDEPPPEPSLYARLAAGLSFAATISRWAAAAGILVGVPFIWGVTRPMFAAFWELPLYRMGTDEAAHWVTVGRLAWFVITLLITHFVARGLVSILQANVYPYYPELEVGARATINTLLRYLVYLVGLIVALQLIYVNLGALGWLLGTLGLGIGLGLQPLFINFLSGLIMFFERHIRVGDSVEVNNQPGIVTRIGMRSTTICTFDNVELVVPNSEFITGTVINWTLTERKLRGRISVGVAYGSDTDLVRRLLLEAAYRNPRVLRDPAPSVWFMDFGDNALHFVLVCWFDNRGDRWDGMIELRYEINRLFAEHGIVIPFPQRTLSFLGDRPLEIRIQRERGGGPPATPPAS